MGVGSTWQTPRRACGLAGDLLRRIRRQVMKLPLLSAHSYTQECRYITSVGVGKAPLIFGIRLSDLCIEESTRCTKDGDVFLAQISCSVVHTVLVEYWFLFLRGIF